MITKRIICITGFLQRLYTPNGVERLWMKLRENEGPNCCVSLLPWDTDWRGFAEHVLRTGPPYQSTIEIKVAAYSWGAGYGFIKLAQQLNKRGIGIKTAVLSDPVYRNVWALWRSLWSPILGEPKIYIPSNVDEVYYFRQREFRPYGCQCVAEDMDCTKIVDCGLLQAPHIWMDEAEPFHRKAIEKLGEAK